MAPTLVAMRSYKLMLICYLALVHAPLQGLGKGLTEDVGSKKQLELPPLLSGYNGKTYTDRRTGQLSTNRVL